MSDQASSQARVLAARGHVPSLAFARSQADELLEACCDDVVARLRNRSSGLRSAIQPFVDLQHRLLESGAGNATRPEELSSVLMAIQERILAILAERYDALDAAARDTELPFAEIDHDGHVVYANDAMAKHIPKPLGRDFASLFGARAKHVAAALAAGRCESLRVELECEGLPRQFRAEIGPLRDHDGKLGAYALLLGLRSEELRLDAALDAIIRTDLTGKIAFANHKALQLLHLQRKEVLGSQLGKWLVPRRPGKGLPIGQRIAHWLSASAAISDDDLTLTGGGQSHPIKVAVVPSYDGPERRSGILMTFRNVREDLARRALRDLLIFEKVPLKVIRKAIQIVRQVVPFDMATFATYSDDVLLCRVQLVEPEPKWRWATRWFDVSPEALEWLQGETWDNDLRRLVDRLAPDLKEDPVWKAVQRDGLNHLVSLPVRGTGGTYRCLLSLMAKDRQYGPEDARTLRDLGLEELLLATQTALERRQELRIRQLKKDLNDAHTTRALAQTLAKGVLNCFGWEYAGVFRVDRKDGVFELFEQRAANEALNIKAPYRQKLTEGMLGHCYRREEVLVLPRVRADGHKYDFIKTAAAQESAMTVPLRVNGRIELILDLEASEENAFAGPEKQLAEALVADCEQILAGRWHEAIVHSLMDAMEQAAIIVDGTGRIRQMNAAARAIVGEATGRLLKEFGAEEDDRHLLGEGVTSEPTSIELGPGNGALVPTLASQQPLNDDYGHRLWLFSNLAEQRWERDQRYLEETVSEVARQARAPLLIADGLLRGAADLLRNPQFVENCASLLERASNQLLKADVTYARLSDSLSVRTHPVEPRKPFEVIKLLREIIEQLPEDEIASIDLQLAEEQTFVIQGWPERLGYALRSILGFLLLSSGNARIVVAAELTGLCDLRIEMKGRRTPATASIVSSGDGDPIAEGEEHARQMVALAPEVVEAVIDLHHGKLEMPDPQKEEAVFAITLPAASESRQ